MFDHGIREGEFVQGQGGGNAADNPFKDGPGKGNQTVQMQMIAKDRAGAERLMQQAGFKPSDWNLS